MIRSLAVIILIMSLVSCGSRGARPQERGVAETKQLSMISEVRDTIKLGAVKSGEKLDYKVALNNNDSVPVVIVDIRTDCGCTTLEYDKKPVKPGENTEISMEYDSRNQVPGMQFKKIYITTSRSSEPIIIALTAEVVR